MLFTKNDTKLLIDALDNLSEDEIGAESIRLTAELQQRLIDSSKRKLANLSSLTHFTKQEYTIMWWALTLEIEFLERASCDVSEESYRLLERLYSLALPS